MPLFFLRLFADDSHFFRRINAISFACHITVSYADDFRRHIYIMLLISFISPITPVSFFSSIIIFLYSIDFHMHFFFFNIFFSASFAFSFSLSLLG